MSLVATTTLFGLKKTAIPILEALAKNWQGVAAAMLVAIVVYQNTFDHRVFFWADTIPYLRNLTDEQLAAIKKIETANSVLRDSIEIRNDQIDEWKDVSIELERNVEQLSVAILTQQTITRNQVRAILSQPTPQTCEASINFLRDHIPDLQYGPRESEQ